MISFCYSVFCYRGLIHEHCNASVRKRYCFFFPPIGNSLQLNTISICHLQRLSSSTHIHTVVTARVPKTSGHCQISDLRWHSVGGEVVPLEYCSHVYKIPIMHKRDLCPPIFTGYYVSDKQKCIFECLCFFIINLFDFIYSLTFGVYADSCVYF